MQSRLLYKSLFALVPLLAAVSGFSQRDSSKALKTVTVTLLQKKDLFSSATPAQALDRKTLANLNAPTAGDAARYFSGVQVKDYGGAGGLKTVSVRSLGAAQTGILYDGLPVSDAQTGQTDLSRYSSTFIQSLQLQQAGPDDLLQPARAFSSAALLSIYTTAFYPALLKKKEWQGGLKTGSFGLLQPSAGAVIPLSDRVTVSANGEALSSKGDYPLLVDNGTFSEKTRRQNARIASLQGEANITALLKDSSVLQGKVWGYSSKRGLPGAIVFFNDRAVQLLWDQDFFSQFRYRRELGKKTALLFSGKYNYSFTRYKDPDYLNGAGGLNNTYTQRESYGSLALRHQVSPALQLGFATDLAYSTLQANLPRFARPSRIAVWHDLSAAFSKTLFTVQANLLETSVWDKTQNATAAAPVHRFLPTAAVQVKPKAESPWMLRLFYKQVFRMPTFNDLYYNFTGNNKLRPEWARQYNAGVVYSIKPAARLTSFHISADAYYNRIRDKIIAVPNKNLFVWTMLNLGTVNITGVDVTAEASGRFNTSWTWFGRMAYTMQKAIDVTDPSSSTYRNRIPYTPDNSGSGLLSVSRQKWTAGYSFLFSGTRYVLGENNPYNQLAGWGIHDLFLSRTLNLRTLAASLKLELDNLTNERYDIVRYYPMPGRSFKISLLFANQY